MNLRSKYTISFLIFILLAIPSMLFQMRGENKIFMDKPFMFFGACLVGALICTYVIDKMWLRKE